MAATLLLAAAIDANAQAPTAQIDRVLFVPLGCLEQWISIRGEDRSNPVLLVVHGGPGEAQWPTADIFMPWDKAFTVVQWGQRGTGHTYGRYSEKTPDITLNRIPKDGVDLAAYLCRELHKKKIIVLGYSWGSLAAVHMVQRRRDLGLRRLLQLRQGTEERTGPDPQRGPLCVDDRVRQVPGGLGFKGPTRCDRARRKSILGAKQAEQWILRSG